MKATLKIGIFIFGSYTIIQNAFAQADSNINKHTPERLWYQQKESWIIAAVIIFIIIIGLISRSSRFRKNSIKK